MIFLIFIRILYVVESLQRSDMAVDIWYILYFCEARKKTIFYLLYIKQNENRMQENFCKRTLPFCKVCVFVTENVKDREGYQHYSWDHKWQTHDGLAHFVRMRQSFLDKIFRKML